MAWTAADIPDQSGRTALVTGANGGLGQETARELARKGAHVVIAARNQEKAAAAEADIRAELPDASLEVIELDLGSLDSVRAAAEATLAKHETLDLLDQQRRADGDARGPDRRRLRDAARRQPPRPLGADREADAGRPPGAGAARRHRNQHRPPHGPRHQPVEPAPRGQVRAVEVLRAVEARQLPLRPRPAEGVRAGRRQRAEPDRPPGPLEHRPAGTDDAGERG